MAELSILKILSTYGLPGILVGVLVVLIVWMYKSNSKERAEMLTLHRDERNEWRHQIYVQKNAHDAEMAKKSDQLLQITERSTLAMEKNAEALERNATATEKNNSLIGQLIPLMASNRK